MDLKSQSHRTLQVFSDCWIFNLLSINELRAIPPLPGKWRPRNSPVGRGFNSALEAEFSETTRLAAAAVTWVPIWRKRVGTIDAIP